MPESLDRLRMVRVQQRFPRVTETAVRAAVRRELVASELLEGLAPGARVAIATGSRKVAHIAEVLQSLVSAARVLGLEPFLVAAMGSHGGGTAEGQRAVLAALGIDEASMGCPVHSSMATVALGSTPDGIPVHVDAVSAAADAVVVVGRVKPHTAFSGSIGSGPLKMLAIGLGKREGAEAVHRAALARGGLEKAIRSVAAFLLAQLPVRGALALVENAEGGLASIKGITARRMESEEPELLARAAELRPGLGFQRLDVLIVDRMGKDISGTGMDPWVIGRMMATGEPEPAGPAIARIYVRSLSPGSGGNAHGVGLADFVHERLAAAIDWEATRINALAAVAPQKARLPLVMSSDREAIAAALACAGVGEPSLARVAHIRDTRNLGALRVSEALAAEADALAGFQRSGPLESLDFDVSGDLGGA